MALRRSVGGLLILALSAVAGSARAGLLDSPAPTPQSGGSLRVVYRMGPVYYDPGWVDTIVMCTNLSAAPVETVLEIFDEQDAPVGGATRAVMPANGAVAFATSTTAGADGAVIVSNLPAITHGKLRVSATTSNITCNGHGRYRGDDGSVKESPLSLVKKVAFGPP